MAEICTVVNSRSDYIIVPQIQPCADVVHSTNSYYYYYY